MSEVTEIFEFLRSCPQLENLFSIAATADIGVKVVLPQGASPAFEYDEKIDALGNYSCDVVPYPSVYKDFEINCFKRYDFQDSNAPSDNLNVMSYDDVQQVCDWIEEQNRKRNFPKLSNKKIISIECNPSVPQIRGIDQSTDTIAYFIAIRIRYVNPVLESRSIYIEIND